MSMIVNLRERCASYFKVLNNLEGEALENGVRSAKAALAYCRDEIWPGGGLLPREMEVFRVAEDYLDSLLEKNREEQERQKGDRNGYMRSLVERLRHGNSSQQI